VVDRLRVPLLPAKPLCDVLAFGGGCVLAMRFFVFRWEGASRRRPARRACRAGRMRLVPTGGGA